MSFRASVKKSICSGLGVWLGNLPGMLKALGRICSWTKQKQNITKKKKKKEEEEGEEEEEGKKSLCTNVIWAF
jgi:hypothetical protein